MKKKLLVVLTLACLLLHLPAQATDLSAKVFVDDKEITLPTPVRAVGRDMLLPLEPVCQALGSKLTLDPMKNTLEVTRVQDNSIAVYSTTTGDTVINGIPANSIKSMVPVMLVPGEVYLPVDICAFLLGVSIQPGLERIEITRNNLESAEVIRPKASWKDMAVDYLDYGLTEDSVKLNPKVSGGPTDYSVVQSMLVGGGGHIGPLTIRTNNKLQGGTNGKFLTFSVAHFQIRHNAAGWRFDGGDTPLKGFFSRQINGYPVRGGLFVKEGKKLNIAAFQGAAFTQGVPVGGGTVRLSYQRYLALNEATYKATPRTTLSSGTCFFTDQSKFVNNTRQNGRYWIGNAAYASPKLTLNGELWLGRSRRTPIRDGNAYLVDLWGKWTPNRRMSLFAEVDRINPNFAHPQIGNAFVNRQDLIVAGTLKPIRSVSLNCNGSFNNSSLEAIKPSSTKILNAGISWTPFRQGPNFNILGSKIWFRPAVGGDNASSQNPTKTTLGALTIDHNVLNTQIVAGVTTTLQQSPGQTRNISNSVNISASRPVFNLGQLQFLTQIGTFISDNTTKTFDIRAVFNTRPIFNRFSFTFGPGYSMAGLNDRFTFIAGMASNVPYLGNYLMNVNRQLALTTSQGRLTNVVRLDKGRGGTDIGLTDTGKLPPFGSIKGLVLESASFPPKVVSKTPTLENITVVLDDQQGIARNTRKDGKWSFDTIPVGKHKVSILLSSAPATLALTSPANYYVQVMPGQVANVNFALARMASVSGKIKLSDEIQKNKDALNGIRIYLKGTELDTLSGSGGDFQITDVPPGNYTLELDTDFLPADLIVESKTKEIFLSSGENLTMIDFLLKPKPRDVQKKVF